MALPPDEHTTDSPLFPSYLAGSLADFLQFAPAAIVVLNEEGEVVYANDEFCQVTGYSAAEIIGLDDWDAMVPSPWMEEMREAFHATWASRAPAQAECPLTSRDGQRRLFSWRHVVCPPREGVPPLMVYVGTDITHQRASERAVRESEERFGRLVNTMDSGLAMLDSEGTFTYVSAPMCNILGRPANVIVGQRVTEFLTPESRADFEQQWDRRSRGERGSYELVWLRPDGEVVHTAVQACPVQDAAGRFVGAYGVVADIGRQKRVQEELEHQRDFARDLLEETPALVVATDNEGKIVLANKAMLGATGYAEEEVLGKDYLTTFVPEAARAEFRALDGAFAGLRDRTASESPLLTKDGRELLVEWHGRVMVHQEDAQPYALATGIDVTQRRQDSEALRESRRALATLMGDLPGMAYRCLNDSHWTMQFISEGCLELTGYSASDLIGNVSTSYGELIHPEDREIVWKGVQQGVTENRAFHLVYRIRTAQGQEKWVSESGRPVRSDTGELVALEGFISDITEAKVAQDRLTHVNRVLRAIRNVNQLITHERDRDLLLARACELLVETRGYKAVWVQLVGPSDRTEEVYHAGFEGNFDALCRQALGTRDLPPCAPAARAQTGVLTRTARDTSCTGCPLAGDMSEGAHFLVRLAHAGTTYGTLAVSVPAEVADSEEERSLLKEVADDLSLAIYAINAAQDERRAAGALRDSEARFRHLFQQSPFPVMVCLPDGTTEVVNAAFLETLGLESAESIVGYYNPLRDPGALGLGTREQLEPCLAGQTVVLPEAAIEAEAIRTRFASSLTSDLVLQATVFPVVSEAGAVVQLVIFWTNVTAERRALSDLRLKDFALSSATSGILITDAEGKVSYANRAAVVMFGYDEADLLGQPFVSLWSQEEAGATALASARRGESWRGELQGRRCNGTVFEAGLTASWAGQQATLAVVNDITQRRRDEQNLRETREQLEALVQSSPVAIVVFDVQERVKIWNPAAEKLFGWTTAEVVDKYVPWTDDEERRQAHRLIARAHRGESFAGLEVQRHTKTGEALDLSLSTAVLRGHDGEMIGLAEVLVDITERRRAERMLESSERRFREMAELLPDMVYELDSQGYVTYGNRAAMETLGLSHEDIETGVVIFDVFDPSDVPELRATLERVAVTREPSVLAADMPLPDAPAVPVEIHVAPSLGIDGQLLGWRGVVRDISERRRAEEAQRLAMIGQLAAGVAHEFNNLLAAMSGRAQLAQALETPAANEQLVNTVLLATERGVRISRDLMGFARPGDQRPEPVHLEHAIDAALGMASRDLQNAQVQVVRHYQSGNQRVLADASQMEQVFLNLIMNAYQAMPGGGTLTVSTEYVPHEGGTGEVVTRVSDTGTGVDPEIMSRIFEPFFTTKRRGDQAGSSGAGLGLAISQSIVSAHGGTLSVQSQVGEGTEFTLRLRAHAGPESRRTEDRENKASVPTATGGRVLLAEDEDEVRDIVRSVLAQHGYEVVTAHDTLSALAALGTAHFDAIVSDLVMPGGGGRQVLAAARSLPGSPPVLLITGMPHQGLEGDLTQLGARGFLHKPFSLPDLIRALGELMGSTRAATDSTTVQPSETDPTPTS
ncbi:PAS domain S-box protein [bacterium]|nr:PAS domain S-box protein [bacterium]